MICLRPSASHSSQDLNPSSHHPGGGSLTARLCHLMLVWWESICNITEKPLRARNQADFANTVQVLGQDNLKRKNNVYVNILLQYP